MLQLELKEARTTIVRLKEIHELDTIELQRQREALASEVIAYKKRATEAEEDARVAVASLEGKEAMLAEAQAQVASLGRSVEGLWQQVQRGKTFTEEARHDAQCLREDVHAKMEDIYALEQKLAQSDHEKVAQKVAIERLNLYVKRRDEAIAALRIRIDIAQRETTQERAEKLAMAEEIQKLKADLDHRHSSVNDDTGRVTKTACQGCLDTDKAEDAQLFGRRREPLKRTSKN